MRQLGGLLLELAGEVSVHLFGFGQARFSIAYLLFGVGTCACFIGKGRPNRLQVGLKLLDCLFAAGNVGLQSLLPLAVPRNLNIFGVGPHLCSPHFVMQLVLHLSGQPVQVRFGFDALSRQALNRVRMIAQRSRQLIGQFRMPALGLR